MLARFRHHYPDASLYSSPRYRTADQVIPFGLFWIYWRAIPRNAAYERLSAIRGITSALGWAFGKPNAPTPESVRQDQRDAFLE